VPYLSASAVVIHYEEALYQVVYAPLPYLYLTSARIGTLFKFCTNADQISKKYDYRLKKILGAAKVWFFIFIATDITDCRNNSAYRL